MSSLTSVNLISATLVNDMSSLAEIKLTLVNDTSFSTVSRSVTFLDELASSTAASTMCH